MKIGGHFYVNINNGAFFGASCGEVPLKSPNANAQALTDIRDFHTLYVAHDMEPPEEIKELFRISIRQAVEVMLRISK